MLVLALGDSDRRLGGAAPARRGQLRPAHAGDRAEERRPLRDALRRRAGGAGLQAPGRDAHALPRHPARSSPAAASRGSSGSRSIPQYAHEPPPLRQLHERQTATRASRATGRTPRTRRALPATRRLLLALNQPAGEPQRRPARTSARTARLYSGQGDGGGSCDPGGRAQNLRSLHGKLLSLNPRNIGAGWRIDAYGLRNPWGYSFDRANGRLYIGDVGQNRWEEVDTLAPSRLGGTPENFGWDAFEGRARSGCATGGLRGPGAHVRPISVYSHSLGCSITGRLRLPRPATCPAVRGWYYFADFCSGRIWRLKYMNGRVVRGRSARPRHRPEHHLLRRGRRRRALPHAPGRRGLPARPVREVPVRRLPLGARQSRPRP